MRSSFFTATVACSSFMLCAASPTGTKPCNATGTSLLPSTSANGTCSTTFTTVLIKTATLTSVTSTYTFASDADVINGDDFGETSPLSPYTYLYFYPTDTVFLSTTTLTATSTPTTTVSGKVITVAAPVGFIGIQDSLPNATYIPYSSTASSALPTPQKRLARRTAYCNATTQTQTSSVTVTVISTFTQTLTGYVVAFPDEGTAFEGDTFTNPKTQTVVYITTTYPATTATITVQANTSVSVIAPASTFYEACATTNFANYVRQPDGTNFAIRSITHEDFVSPQPVYVSPEDCCAFAIQNNAAAWDWTGYGPGYGCSLSLNTAEECSFEGTSVTAFVEPEITDFDITPIYGNGYCGQVDTGAPFVNITGNPGST